MSGRREWGEKKKGEAGAGGGQHTHAHTLSGRDCSGDYSTFWDRTMASSGVPLPSPTPYTQQTQLYAHAGAARWDWASGAPKRKKNSIHLNHGSSHLPDFTLS